ncbi:MAG: tetratricopeptide repeat protein, partial [Cyclobacteriaceae bacterium]|nr:tetratricopeptide repeat protein [Cyclobacteriaceae bacterium]
ITEEIINMLAQVPQLKVIGRTSSFAFKGKNLDLKFIGEQLKVSHILEGSVRKSGNKLRITAQLISVADGFHLYSEKFDRELEDVFKIQDEISEAILKAVKIKLLDEEKVDVFKRYTDNIEAFELVLKGRYHYNKFTPDNFLKAIENYQSAIDLDPNYAIAYAEIGHCYWDAAFFNWAPAEDYVPKALAAINKALQLDPHNDICLAAKGTILIWYEWDFKQAGIYLKEAIQINPNNVIGQRQNGALNMLLGNYEESFKHYERAGKLDPFSLIELFYHGAHHIIGGHFEKVFEYGNRLITLEPYFSGGHLLLGVGYSYLKQYDKAIEALETAVKLNTDLVNLSTLGLTYAKMGERGKAEEILEKMQTLAFPNEGNAFFVTTYFALKNCDRAFDYFMKAVKNHEGHTLVIPALIRDFFKETPELLQDPRTIALLKMIGLPN